MVLLAIYGGNVPLCICEHFPRKIRYSGVGLGYNMAHAIFTSTCSLVLTMLVSTAPNRYSADRYSPSGSGGNKAAGRAAVSSPSLSELMFVSFDRLCYDGG